MDPLQKPIQQVNEHTRKHRSKAVPQAAAKEYRKGASCQKVACQPGKILSIAVLHIFPDRPDPIPKRLYGGLLGTDSPGKLVEHTQAGKVCVVSAVPDAPQLGLR